MRFLRLSLPLSLVCAVTALHRIPLGFRPYDDQEAEDMVSFLQADESSIEGSSLPKVELTPRFYGIFGAGTPRQDFEVVYDTGSDVAWVYGDKCTNCNGRQKFVGSKSSSLVKRDKAFTIQYGTGDTGGDTVQETLHVGDLEVDKQVLGIVKQTDDVLRGFAFSGVVGMSFPMKNEPAGFLPIIQAAFTQNFKTTITKALKPTSAASLQRDSDGKLPLGGAFSFFLSKNPADYSSFMFVGTTDEMNQADDLKFAKVLRINQYWEVPFKGITVIPQKEGADGSLERGSQEIHLKNACVPYEDDSTVDQLSKCIASIDTGHSLISGPPAFIAELNTHLSATPNADKLEFEKNGAGCSEEGINKLPDVSFNFDGFSIKLAPKDYTIDLGNGQCTPGFRNRDPKNGHAFIFGEHYLRSVYTMFNMEDETVGMALSPEESKGTGLAISHLSAKRKDQQGGQSTTAMADASFEASLPNVGWYNDIPEATVLGREPHPNHDTHPKRELIERSTLATGHLKHAKATKTSHKVLNLEKLTKNTKKIEPQHSKEASTKAPTHLKKVSLKKMLPKTGASILSRPVDRPHDMVLEKEIEAFE